jgi:hypothetical protein
MPGYSKGDFEESTFLSREDREKRLSGDLTSVDQILVTYAGTKTPEEIGVLTGIPADEVAKRTLAVLNKVDYFTIQQKRAQMMLMLQGVISEVYVRRESMSDRNLGSAMNSAGGNIQRILKTLEDMEKRDEKSMQAQEEAYARRLLMIVNRAFDRQLGALTERFPAIDAKDIAAEFQASIMSVAREMDIDDAL